MEIKLEEFIKIKGYLKIRYLELVMMMKTFNHVMRIMRIVDEKT